MSVRKTLYWWLVCVTISQIVFSLDELDSCNYEPSETISDWGDDHVAQNFPEYITGDECLFCHREIGKTWGENRHQLTIRMIDMNDPAVRLLRTSVDEKQFTAQVDLLMGSHDVTRFLKRSHEYGKLELLNSTYRTELENGKELGRLIEEDSPLWNKNTFGDRCAGCHTTAVDSQTKAFSAISLDCFTCHGDVDLSHTKDIAKAFLSRMNRVPRQVVSICGQCHLRGGKSRSTGLPYPNTFVAGDNLLRDYQVDLSAAAIQALPEIEKHIFSNVKAVAEFNQTELTCLNCHDVHTQSAKKHQQLTEHKLCWTCHMEGSEGTELRPAFLASIKKRTHNRTCDY